MRQPAARIRLRHPRWLLIVLLASLLFLWIDNPLTQVFLMLTAGVTVLAGLWTAVSAVQAVALAASADRVMAGQPVELRLQVRRSWLPLPWVQVTDLSSIWPRAPRYVVSLGFGRTAVCAETAVPPRRGVYALGPVAAAWGDPFGLFETRRDFAVRTESIVVYPRVVPLLAVPLPLRQPFGRRRPRREAFEDVTAPSDQRPYRPGDSLRRVNWKTTARLGELYTREYEYTAATDLHIFVDMAAASYDRALTGVANDEATAEVAAAVAEFGLRSGFAVSMTAYAPDRLHVPLRHGRHQLQPLLELLAVATATGTVSPAQALTLEQHHVGPLATMVVISPDSSPDLAASLALLRQRGVSLLVLTVRPEGGRASREWERQLQSLGIVSRSVSGPAQLNEGGGARWSPSARS